MRHLFLTVLILLISSTNVFGENGLQADNARLHEAPPSVSVHAGYLDINNPHPEPVDLIAVSSPVFEYIEIHLSSVEDGVARMRQQKKITIPANSSLSLSPGEYHLMLFNNSQPLPAGSEVPLELLFSNGEIIPLTANVIRQDGTHEHHH